MSNYRAITEDGKAPTPTRFDILFTRELKRLSVERGPENFGGYGLMHTVIDAYKAAELTMLKEDLQKDTFTKIPPLWEIIKSFSPSL